MASLVVEIQVFKEGRPVHTEPMGPNALFIGRAPDNDLILHDSRVSGRHAVFHLSSDRANLLLRDLGSTNGTFVNNQRLTGVRTVQDGDEVLLGSSASLKVRVQRSHHAAPLTAGPALLVDLRTCVAVPATERMKVGSADDCEVKLPDVAPLLASITLHEDGEIWVGTEERDFSVVVGESFNLAGHTLVFRDSRDVLQSTQREAGPGSLYPYRLTVSLMTSEALVEDPAHGIQHMVTAENRVSLLYVLARKRKADLAEGVPPGRAGWVEDDEIMAGIWGKAREQMGANNYQVLLSRLRKELRKSEFDGWFIEKRRGHTRVRIDTIEVD